MGSKGNQPGGPTEAASQPADSTRVHQFTLRVDAGPDEGLAHTSAGDRVVVGTDPSADFQLTDRTVSRRHAAIEIAEGRAQIRDLGSRNGTVVDGVRVRDADLGPDARIQLGDTAIRFAVTAEWVAIELSERAEFGGMRGNSRAMRATFARLQRAAESDATLLIEGETGTGKELAAESVHRESRRGAGPFIVVDCAAIPENLLESELFGHEEGAFTGATGARAGAFEEAAGGTVFLDEIGELPPSFQPKLLRVLERRHTKRVGSNRYRDIDVRVIAATNRDLSQEVNEGRFRADLYYRIAVLSVRLPPLRERPSDIAVLAEGILHALGSVDTVDADTLRRLRGHTWPGNVRELRNYLERYAAFRDDPPRPAGEHSVGVEGLCDPTVPFREARARWSSALERQYLRALLEHHGGNVSAAARGAKLDRAYLYRLLSRSGLRGGE